MTAADIKVGHAYRRRHCGSIRVVVSISDDASRNSGKVVVFHGTPDIGSCDLWVFAQMSDCEVGQELATA